MTARPDLDPGGPTAAPWVPRRAHRSHADGMLAGVAAGVAQHLSVPALWVRVGLLLATPAGGLGVVLYGALWLVLPVQPPPDDEVAPGLAAASRQDRRRAGREHRLVDRGPLAAVGALAAGVLLALGVVTGRTDAIGPPMVAAVGVALLWWQADQSQRERWTGARGQVGPWRAVVGDGGAAAYLRIGGGLLLVVLAAVMLGLRGGLVLALDVGVVAALSLVALAVVLAPWLVRLSADLSQEREARVRTQERADVAAHLHDSVLQTLALIQRSADDPASVARLARAQERDLRRWLFEPEAVGPPTLAAALGQAADEVEDASGVVVQVVCVGDVRLTDTTRPLVSAVREAMHNAARHSGAPTVDAYVEAGPAGLEAFVRDRGRGFDPDAVPAHRHGLRGSVVGRLQRHGGRAEVRSRPGEGTEIRMWLPTAPGATEEGP